MIWGTNALLYTETQEEFCSWYRTMLRNNVVRQVSPTQSHQSNGAAEKAISTVRGLARTYLAAIKDKIGTFDVKIDSPTLP